MPSADTKDITPFVAKATEIRHAIHQFPELNFQEVETAKTIRAELDRLGIAWRACAGTGTIATLNAKAKGKHIAFRADIDALPIKECTGVPWMSKRDGFMHACGHDGHTATLLGTAAYFKAHESELPGPISLLFQPAEEGGHGAKVMIENGALEGIDEIFGFHNWPPFPFGRAAAISGTIMAANGTFHVTIKGRGGHASQPEQTIDPIVAGANFVSMAQQIVSRQIAPQNAAVVSVTYFHGGTTDNVIPESIEIMGTVRAATTAMRDDLVKRLEKVLHAACAPSGATATIRYEPVYPATVNHPESAAKAAAALKRILGADCLWTERLPIMGAEDFSYYLEKIPGCYVLLGAGRPGATLEPCHSPRFDFNDELIPVGLKLWCDLAGLQARAVTKENSR